MMRHVPARGVRRALTGALLAFALFGTLALWPISALARSQQRITPLDGQHPAHIADGWARAALGASGPVLPIPSTLWQPAAGAVPTTGDYVYLKSDTGDYVGQGRTYLYTRADAVLDVSASGGLLTVSVNGDEWWHGNFATMTSITDLEQGYYPGLERYPGNPVNGGLDWSGEGRGSNTLTGWFAIDSVTYDNGDLTAITLRFALHSEGGKPALHGAIHWEADDTTQPPGPVLPIPGTLWQPAVGVVPASGNYVYLESDPGDYVGAGRMYLYTPATAELGVSASGGRLTATVNGDEIWHGFFTTMSSLTDPEQGYYPGLERYPGNPAKGSLDWFGDGRGSNELTGWFAIDSVTYDNGDLTAIALRFVLHSEGGKPALRGAIHWDAAAAQSQTATALTLTAPSACPYQSATLKGTLKTISSQPLVDAPVIIRCTTGGPWKTLGTATTDANGAFRFAVAPTTIVAYQAIFAGDDTNAGTTSMPAATLPKVYLSTPRAPKSTHTTTTFTCSCYLKPHHPARKYAVIFQFQQHVSSHWVTEGAVKARAANYGGYSKCSVKIRLLLKGWWRVRAIHPADSLNATTLTRWRAVKVL
jgi:hypothetical protein